MLVIIIMKRFTWFILVACLIVEGSWGSQEVLKQLTKGFAVALLDCKNEQDTGDHVMEEFYNFWNGEYGLVSHDFGCIVLCMGQKLGLVDPDNNMKVHHGNAQEFAETHGANEELAKQLVALVDECEKTHETIEDHCARILEIVKCFRTKIHERKWAPSMTEVMDELLNFL